MSRKIIFSAFCGFMLLSPVLHAGTNQWANYKAVERPQKKVPTITHKYQDQYGRPMTQELPVRPQYQHPYPIYPNQSYPSQNGVTIIYNHQLPTQTEYSGSSSGYVNGNGSIQSSQYMLISDWRRYDLPDPQVGMHWIFENGRYVQIPNGQ